MIFFVVSDRQSENSFLNADNSPKSLDNNGIRELSAVICLRNEHLWMSPQLSRKF